METTAILGKGIREAFVMAVGLALERALALMNEGAIKQGRPEIDNGEDLLQLFETIERANASEDPAEDAHEDPALDDLSESQAPANPAQLAELVASSMDGLAPGGAAQAMHGNDSSPQSTASQTTPGDTGSVAREHSETPPRLPDSRLAAGTIWPPVAGRIALHEICGEQTAPQCQPGGSWTARAADRWRLESQADQLFGDLEQGRQALLSYARRHNDMRPILTEHRCVALVPNDDGRWRLWQIVRAEKNLTEALEDALRADSPVTIATTVFAIAKLLFNAARTFSTYGVNLPVGLDAVTQSDGKPVYTGMVPLNKGREAGGEPTELDLPDFIRAQFKGPISKALAQRAINVTGVLHRLKQIQGVSPRSSALTEALSALFIGH